MKRYISLILILVLVMSFGAAAFADDPGGTVVYDETSKTLTAVPASGYQFQKWSNDSTDNPLGGVEPADKSAFTATFKHVAHTFGSAVEKARVEPTKETAGYVDEEKTCDVCGEKITERRSLPALGYTVTVSSDPSLYGNAIGGNVYQSGVTATVTAIPNTNYQFVNWTENGAVASEQNPYSFTINADRALVAHFVINPTPSAAVYHTITYLDDNGALIGTENKEDNISCYIWNARAVKAGYSQVGWQTKKDGTGTTYEFGKRYDTNADLTLYPVWTKTGGTTPVGTCTLTFAPGTYGTGKAFSQWFYSGTAVTLPGAGYFTRSGYTQTGWSYDPNGSTCDKAPAANTFLYSDTTLYPYWSADTGSKTVYIDYSDYGAVYWGNAKMERGRTITLKPNESVTLTFSPVNQYYVYNVNVNGYNLGSRDSYTFSYNEMTGNKSIYVKFGSIYGKPKTGDDSNLGLWIILGMSSMAGCAAAVTVSKKRREY